MRKLLGTFAALLAIMALTAATLASGPHDRHLFSNSMAKDTPSGGGWPDGTAQNSNW